MTRHTTQQQLSTRLAAATTTKNLLRCITCSNVQGSRSRKTFSDWSTSANGNKESGEIGVGNVAKSMSSCGI